MNSKGTLFVFSAPSGSGKTTIVRKILSENADLTFSISATTRKRRNEEIEGKHYFFITEGEFKKKIENNEFIEWERFYDYYYGTLKNFVDTKIAEGTSVVLEVDVKGALNIKKAYPDSVLIFIAPPSREILRERLVKRNTETEVDLKKRIERAEMELAHQDEFDYCVVNDDLNSALQEVRKIIKSKLNKQEI